VIQQAHAMDDPDCISVASLMEEDPAIALENGNFLRFAAAMRGDGRECSTIIDGYLSPAVMVALEEEVEPAPEPPQQAPPTPIVEAVEVETVATAWPSIVLEEPLATLASAHVPSPEVTLPSTLVQAQRPYKPDESLEPFRATTLDEGLEETLEEAFEEEPRWPALELTHTSLPAEVAQAANHAYTFEAAQRFIYRDLSFEYLIPEVVINPITQARYIYYHLPPAIAANRYILDVLGQTLPTRAGEHLPAGVFAIVPHFPESTVARIGPHIWTNLEGVAYTMYGRSMEAMYQTLEYPPYLFSEIFLQFQQQDRFSPFRATDRVGPFVGRELEGGWIEHGSVYLCTDEQGGWRLFEYPYLPPTADCVVLLWNWNPVVDGERVYNPSPGTLVPQQNAQLNRTIRARLNGLPLPDNIGPSIVFRTDAETGESDFIVFPAFAYLNNTTVLADLAFGTPLPSGRLPDPERTILASPDLHYAYTNGAGTGAGLEGAEGAGRPKLVEPTDFEGLPLRSLGYYSNSTSIYIGLNELPPFDPSLFHVSERPSE
jgi:hypothetical protein